MWIQFLWKFKRMSYCVVFIIYGNFIFLFHILLSSLNVCVHRSTGCSVHKYILVSVWVVIKLSGGMTMPLLFCIKRLKNEWKHIKKNAIQKKKQDEIFFCIRNVLNLFTFEILHIATKIHVKSKGDSSMEKYFRLKIVFYLIKTY